MQDRKVTEHKHSETKESKQVSPDTPTNKDKDSPPSNRNKFFHSVQTTNVNIRIEQPKEDCFTTCCTSLMKCFGKGGS